MIVGFMFNWTESQHLLSKKNFHIQILIYTGKITIQYISRVLQTFLQLHSTFYKESSIHLFVQLW